MRGSRFGHVELGDLLCRIEAGKSPLADDTPAGQGEWGVLKVSAIQPGRFVAQENKAVRDAALIHPGYEVRPGDLIMTRANTEELVGLACVAVAPPPRLMLSDKTLRLVVDESVADPTFLALVLAQPSMRQRIRSLATGTSGSMKNIGQGQIRGLLMPDVPLDEQRRIVAAHNAIERRVKELERVSDKRYAALQAVIGSFWQGYANDMGSIESACSALDAGITLGAHRAPRNKPIGYLRVANVRKGSIDLSDIAVLEAGERDRPRYELRRGDVLVVEGHADPEQIGRAAVVTGRAAGLLYQNHLFRLRFDRAMPEFGMLWLNSAPVRNYWKSRCATSSGLHTINRRLLNAVPFPNVSTSEQKRIVGVWRSGQADLAVADQQIAKLRVVQQGLTEDLLAGRALPEGG
ncbi:hypothetical protein V6P99_11285 [Streptomyces virginiae]|uniref:restriction endonuclease subunit S n=1 Tax=Streptomyces virginiae TaxID=1961 RepID=UPI0030CEFFDC